MPEQTRSGYRASCAMSVPQTLFLAFAGSLPLVSVVALARGIVCIYRTARSAHWPLTALAVIWVAVMLSVLVACAVIWFAEAVSHGPKDQLEDLLLLFGSGVAVYGTAVGLWLFSRYVESVRIQVDSARPDDARRPAGKPPHVADE